MRKTNSKFKSNLSLHGFLNLDYKASSILHAKPAEKKEKKNSEKLKT